MSNAKKCDKCGKFYCNEEKNTKLFDHVVGGIQINDTKGRDIEFYDLCDSCAKALVIWLSQADKTPE